MKTERVTIAVDNEKTLPGIIWFPDTAPRMVLQITHGMTEHIGRYEELAQKLTAQGIAVAGFDLRGHGENGSDDNTECASFGKGRWRQNLHDMYMFSQLLERRLKGVPHFMLGFSLGSFLLRDYLGDYSKKVNFDGAIIMGSGWQPGFVLSLIIAVVKSEAKKSGFDNPTDMTDKLSLENYNRKFMKNAASFAWLCSDEEQLEDYSSDKLNRKHISSGLFYQLLCAMQRTGKRSSYLKWDHDMPILLLSGEDDPVGDFGKGVKKIYSEMKKGKMKSVELSLIPGARHDLFHETASGAADKSVEVLLDWLNRHARNA